MALKEDLETQVKKIFADQWDEEKTATVPDPDKLRLDNHAKNLETATVLYADLNGSTNMVDQYAWWFSAEVYKAYLRCAARIIASEGGVVTAYDGDRVMAVFTGDTKNTDAVRAAMKINYTVEKIIRPAVTSRYPEKTFILKHAVGVDTSQLRAARIGVRGFNDLVWVGRAANYAAKLTNLPDKSLWITGCVYDRMMDSVKTSSGQNMWEKRIWKSMNNLEIYCSNWTFSI